MAYKIQTRGNCPEENIQRSNTLCFTTRQSLLAQGLLVVEEISSHSDTSHSVGLLYMRDRPIAETST